MQLSYAFVHTLCCWQYRPIKYHLQSQPPRPWIFTRILNVEGQLFFLWHHVLYVESNLIKFLHEGMWLHTYKKGKIVFEGLPAWKWLLYELQELGWTQHTIKEQQW